MEPAELAEYLDVARTRGATEVEITFVDGRRFAFKLAPEPQSGAPFVDAKGAPVNLDEGAPWNTREPDTGDDLYRANFPGKPDEAP
jgi:hypothetical protein